MTAIAAAFAVFWASPLGAAADSADERAVIRQDISIRAKGAGPAVQLPPPRADRAVVDEVIGSLDVMKRDHQSRAPAVESSGASKRVSRPFPEPPFLLFSPRSVAAPYDTWVFEVVSKGEVLWRQEGVGQVEERLEWDGTGAAGEFAARVDQAYYYRFTGHRAGRSFTVVSEPVTLKSLAYREYLGSTRLEVANRFLFEPGASALSPGALAFLKPLGDRMRRVGGREPYKLELYDEKPAESLAKQRAEALRRWFADYLLINAAQIGVDLLTAGTRGDATACILPVEKGETFRIE